MTKFKPAFLAAVATLALSGVAHSQLSNVKVPVTGTTLYNQCSQRNGSNYKLTVESSNIYGAENFCRGFILGAVQSNPAIQLPAGVAFDDAKEVIQSYLAQHPELRYLPAAKLIETVLVSAYPR
jgi:Rap1a immunity proteins